MTKTKHNGKALEVVGFLTVIVVSIIMFRLIISTITHTTSSDDYCYFERRTDFSSVVGNNPVYERHFVPCPKE